MKEPGLIEETKASMFTCLITDPRLLLFHLFDSFEDCDVAVGF